MEYLECDRCGERYADQASIDSAKQMKADWEAMCRKDGDEPRGISPCPILLCRGELVLKQ